MLPKAKKKYSSHGIQTKKHHTKRLRDVVKAFVVNAKNPLDSHSDVIITYVTIHDSGEITGNCKVKGVEKRVTLVNKVTVEPRKTIHGVVMQVKKSNPVWEYVWLSIAKEGLFFQFITNTF